MLYNIFRFIMYSESHRGQLTPEFVFILYTSMDRIIQCQHGCHAGPTLSSIVVCSVMLRLF
jgi:hypothetical protein